MLHSVRAALFITSSLVASAHTISPAAAQGTAYVITTANEILEVGLADGKVIASVAVTSQASNAVAFDRAAGTQGLLYYGTQNGLTLRAWNPATGLHTLVGNVGDPQWTNPFMGALFDAAFWPGGHGIERGYYTVGAGNDDLYRVELGPDGLSIVDVVKVGDVMNDASLGFGDIAFAEDGLLHLSTNGALLTYDLATQQVTDLGPLVGGQITFGNDRQLYSLTSFQTLDIIEIESPPTSESISLDLTFTAADISEHVTDPWGDLGSALAGAGPAPIASGSGPLTPDSENVLALSGAPPGTAAIVLGASEAFVPFKGGVLAPTPDVVITGIPISPDGTATLPFTWPAATPATVTFIIQFWMTDVTGPAGFVASNGLRGVSS